MTTEYAAPTTSAGKSLEDICVELAYRRRIRFPLFEAMRLVAQHYNGQIAVPLPEIDASERVATANLIALAIDGHSARVSSVLTEKFIPPTKGGVDKYERQAIQQRRVLAGWDHDNQRDIFEGRRARWITAYSNAPVVIRPNTARRAPSWELINPLGTYPAEQPHYDDYAPRDMIATYIRTYAWLKKHYPNLDSALQAGKSSAKRYKDDDRFELLEYIDGEVCVTAILGSGSLPALMTLWNLGYPAVPLPFMGPTTYAIELERCPNLAEVCTAVVGNRLTLDSFKGMTDDMIGIFQMQAKMMALEVNAVAKAIYPDDWFVETATGGEIVTMADGLRGVIGHIRGGTIVQQQMQPGIQTMNIVNTLERNARVNASIPADYGAESSSNVRTGQRGMNIMSNAVDFRIQEDQRVIARCQQLEYERAIAVDKAYFARDKKSFYVSWGRDKGQVDYTPGDLWAGKPPVFVNFNWPGMDANTITIMNGQKLGERVLSRWTAMHQDPSIRDPDTEKGRVITEALEDALLSSVQSQSQTNQMPVTDLARLIELCGDGTMSLHEAMAQVQKEAQQRQATAGDVGTAGGPAQPGTPAAQPGIGGPGAAVPTIPAPSAGQGNLKQLFSDLAAGKRLAGGG